MMDIILKLCNFEVVQTQNGFEAFEKAAEAMKYQKQNIKHIVQHWEHDTFQMFDLIILDLNMPIYDGFEACRKINQMYEEKNLLELQEENATEGLVKHLKPLLFACTGDNVEDPEMKRSLDAAGFDEALTNPLTTSYIKDKMIPMLIENLE